MFLIVTWFVSAGEWFLNGFIGLSMLHWKWIVSGCKFTCIEQLTMLCTCNICTLVYPCIVFSRGLGIAPCDTPFRNFNYGVNFIKLKMFSDKFWNLLQSPVEEWPICDCLISFHSKGFPLDKAIQYEKLRKPYVINNLHMQYDIQVFLSLYFLNPCILLYRIEIGGVLIYFYFFRIVEEYMQY